MNTRLANWLQQVTQSARAMLDMSSTEDPVSDLVGRAKELLSRKGEATGLALANSVVSGWYGLSPEQRAEWFQQLLGEFGVDEEELKSAIDSYQSQPSSVALAHLHKASEPQRQELFRRFNAAPGGLECLIQMRAELRLLQREDPQLKAIEHDFLHLFSSWFNKGFLILRQIDWNTPAHILEKLIQYESVHESQGWNDLRRRLADDRRCFGYFHPMMPDEPLIFVEVALVNGMADAIAPLLAPLVEDAPEPDTAVFYSINNCQPGLSGVSFGNLLIKQVASRLQSEMPNLKRFVTLSPVPGFRKWVERHFESVVEEDLTSLCALYLTQKRGSRLLDPVARFHLGNGARLERVNLAADASEIRQKQSYGIMVNYLYEPDLIVDNHEKLMEEGVIALSKSVQQLVKTADAKYSEQIYDR